MRRVSSVILGIFAIVFLTALPNAQAPSPTAAAPPAVTFARDIQPILEKSCASCHSGDLKLADLDLSNREAAMRGGEHGAVIVAGNSEKSKLYRMVAGLDQPVMPMQGDPLKPTEVAAIKAWIDQGANWESAVSFAKDIQPIMERSCWNCHGESMQLSKLDLRTREGALRGGAHGPAATPGNAEQSRLYRAVAHLDAIKMPMQGDKLKPEEVAAFKAWIDQGMPWDASATPTAAKPATSAIAALENVEFTPEQRNYWAFQLPVQKTPPIVSKAEFSHPIDRFLEAARAEKNLVAAPRADKRTLIRRAYIDLIGLPPSPADVDAFVADQSDDAWDKLITKLLASPQYGERWGRHWLDVARYADSNGFEQDYDRPNAWRYRDYVINAFNQDKPYNQFLKEQIAGDELDYVTHETLIATGFLRAGPRVLFREKDNPERRWDYVDDLIATMGRGVMGMTVNCARCHNHKFDPIAQKDYYSLAAAINGWVETDWPLVASRTEAETYLKKNKDDRRQDRGAARQDPGDREAVPRRAACGLHQEGIPRERAESRLQARGGAHARRAVARDAGAHRRRRRNRRRNRQDDEARGAGSEERAHLADRGHREAAAEGAADGGDHYGRRLALRADGTRGRDDRLSEMPAPTTRQAQRHVPAGRPRQV